MTDAYPLRRHVNAEPIRKAMDRFKDDSRAFLEAWTFVSSSSWRLTSDE